MLYDLAWKDLWSRLPELNRRPSNYESDALPTELSRPFKRNASAFSKKLHYTNAKFVVSSNRTKRRNKYGQRTNAKP